MKDKYKARITFYAAACMEFPEQWAFYDNLTLEEAVKAYQKILKQGGVCGPGIGFVLHDKRFPDYSDIHWGLYEGGRINDTQINLIKAYREHPLIKQAVRDMEHYIPEIKKTRKSIAMER